MARPRAWMGFTRAEGAVAVAAGALVGEAVAEAADPHVGHAEAGAVHGDEAVDLPLEGVVEERLGVPRRIPEALFADVADEGDRALGDHLRLVHGADDADQHGAGRGSRHRCPGPSACVPSFVTSTLVSSGKTVSRWAAMDQVRLRSPCRAASARTLPIASIRTILQAELRRRS